MNLGAYDLRVNGLTVGTGTASGTSSSTNNTAVGNGVLAINTTGTNNSAFGYQTLDANTTGSNNSAVGQFALGNNAGGNNNTAVGNAALFDNTSGSANTSIGKSALQYSKGSNNTAIGAYADINDISLSNATAIGHGARVRFSNTIQLGADGTTLNSGQLPTTAITNVSTTGTLTLKDVTYPNTHGTANQVLSTTGSGTLTWTTVSNPSDASTTVKGIIQLAGDLRGTATSPTVNTVGGVNSATIALFDTRITSVTNSTTSNTSSITSLNTSVNAATNNNTVSTIVKRDASGNFSAGTITANLTGNVTGNLTGNATTATTAGNVTGTVAVANGGTGATTVAAALTNLGAAPISSPIFTDIPQAPTAIAGTNTTQIATTAFVKSAIRLNSDEFTATLNQTVFTFTTATSNTGAVQIPLTKPFMYINGTRIKNTAYTWTSGNTYVTYVPANNNSYTLVAGDRVQFDYAY